MASFLSEYGISLLIAAALAACVFFVARHMYKNRGCGCGCSSCRACPRASKKNSNK